MWPQPIRLYTLGENYLVKSYEGITVESRTPEAVRRLKKRYLRRAIAEFEYSFAPEYAKKRMSRMAVTRGTLDFDPNEADSHVEPSVDGAWVTARVWVPKQWLQARRRHGGSFSIRGLNRPQRNS
jgi:hypothetical protein